MKENNRFLCQPKCRLQEIGQTKVGWLNELLKLALANDTVLPLGLSVAAFDLSTS